MVLFGIGIITQVKAQAPILSDSDYEVYNYLIHQSFVQDTLLKHFQAKIDDTTNNGTYQFGLADTGTFISWRESCNFDKLKRTKYPINRFKLVTWPIKRSPKLAKLPLVRFEFSKCYFFNKGNSVILYFGLRAHLGGASYVEILGRESDSWKILMKRLQRVG